MIKKNIFILCWSVFSSCRNRPQCSFSCWVSYPLHGWIFIPLGVFIIVGNFSLFHKSYPNHTFQSIVSWEFIIFAQTRCTFFFFTSTQILPAICFYLLFVTQFSFYTFLSVVCYQIHPLNVFFVVEYQIHPLDIYFEPLVNSFQMSFYCGRFSSFSRPRFHLVDPTIGVVD